MLDLLVEHVAVLDHDRLAKANPPGKILVT